jgi:hypothetical protein
MADRAGDHGRLIVKSSNSFGLLRPAFGSQRIQQSECTARDCYAL